MSKTTTITLRDTGYRTAGSVGALTEVAWGDSGTATTLTLKVTDINYNIDVGSNTKAVPNRFENNDQTEIFGLVEVDSIGIGVPTITLTGAFNMESSDDRLVFAKLISMTKTLGVKEFSGTPAATSWINFINYYDDYYAHEAKSTAAVVEHVHVKITNFNVKAPASTNMATWSLTLRETK